MCFLYMLFMCDLFNNLVLGEYRSAWGRHFSPATMTCLGNTALVQPYPTTLTPSTTSPCNNRPTTTSHKKSV